MYTNIDDIIPPLNNEGYDIQDPWDVVEAFEDKVAKYAGSKYAVATDSCTNSLFLCLKYLNATGKVKVPSPWYLPSLNSPIYVPNDIVAIPCP